MQASKSLPIRSELMQMHFGTILILMFRAYLTLLQVPEKVDPDEGEENWADVKLDTKDKCMATIESDLCAEAQVAADPNLEAKAEPAVPDTLPQSGVEEVLLPLQPAYKLNKVKQKMTMEDLEAAAEEEVDDDPDYEEEVEENKESKRGGRGKRKRSSSSDSEKGDEDAIFYPECSMEVGSEEAKPQKKKGRSAKRKVKPARARKKKKKGVISEEEGEEEEDNGTKDEGEGPGLVKEEGPLDMNLFALGFEETEVKDIVVKKSMTQGERLSMKV